MGKLHIQAYLEHASPPNITLFSVCICVCMWQILANVIIFTCGNLAGAYHKHLMDLALKQTYQDTCNCIKSPIKLEFEKHQQVNTQR